VKEPDTKKGSIPSCNSIAEVLQLAVVLRWDRVAFDGDAGESDSHNALSNPEDPVDLSSIERGLSTLPCQIKDVLAPGEERILGECGGQNERALVELEAYVEVVDEQVGENHNEQATEGSTELLHFSLGGGANFLADDSGFRSSCSLLGRSGLLTGLACSRTRASADRATDRNGLILGLGTLGGLATAAGLLLRLLLILSGLLGSTAARAGAAGLGGLGGLLLLLLFDLLDLLLFGLTLAALATSGGGSASAAWAAATSRRSRRGASSARATGAARASSCRRDCALSRGHFVWTHVGIE